MRPRAGTQQITLEPSRVVEIMTLMREYDDRLKAMQQDLVRAETKLRVERKWTWPIRALCVGLGVALLAAIQNEALMTYIATQATALWQEIQAKGNASLFMLVITGVIAYGAIWAIRRAMRQPTPEQQARKLMEQFAKADGVAAYVFADETPEDDAAVIGALTEPKNKKIRQRHLTTSHRTLQSRMTRLLHRIEDGVEETVLH
jgi:hypothetical protein